MNADFLSNPKAMDVLNKPRFPGAGFFPGQSAVEGDQDRMTRLARNVFNHQKLNGEIPEDAVFVPPQFAQVAPVFQPQQVQAPAPVQIVAPATIAVAPVAPVAPQAAIQAAGEPAAIAALQAEKVVMPGDDADEKKTAAPAITTPAVAAVPPGKRPPEDPQPPAQA